MSWVWLAVAWIARGFAALLIVTAVAPLIRSGSWPIRVWDYPRLQLAAISVLVMVVLGAIWLLDVGRGVDLVLMGLLVVSGGWQASHLARYTPVWRTQTPGTSTRGTRVLVSNLDYRNTRRDEVREMLVRTDPEILFLIEIDSAWLEALEPVRRGYPHRVEDIRPNGHGLALWSRLRIEDASIEHLVSKDRPSIHADLSLADRRRIRLVALHPAPPALARADDDDRLNSRIRDAELTLVARRVAAEPRSSWLILGDFNDVAWSHTTRLFERLSGLTDPRVGRMLLNTYHAEHPLLRYPLDHVYLSPGFSIGRLERVRAPGSDHFAVLAEFTLDTRARNHADADDEDREEAREMVREGRRDARAHSER